MEIITSVVTWVTGNLATLLEVVGFLAFLSTLTPNKADDRFAQVLLDLINFGGANFGKAKNNK